MKFFLFNIVFLVTTCLKTLDADSGGGSSSSTPSSPSTAGDLGAIPKCKIASSEPGKLPTWPEVLDHFKLAWKNSSVVLEKEQGRIDPKVKGMIMLSSLVITDLVFACLPQYVQHPEQAVKLEEEYDDGDYEPEDDDDEDVLTEDEDDEDVLTEAFESILDKIRRMVTKAKEVIKRELNTWEVKDTFLLLCSTPGLFILIVEVGKFCLKKKVKGYAQRLNR